MSEITKPMFADNIYFNNPVRCKNWYIIYHDNYNKDTCAYHLIFFRLRERDIYNDMFAARNYEVYPKLIYYINGYCNMNQ